MAVVSKSEFVDTVVELFVKAETELREDVLELIRNAEKREEGHAKLILQSILKNVETAKKERIPMCQDTGVPVIFLEIGKDVEINFNIKDSLREAIVRATKEVPLRPNAVHPVTRKNSGNNTGFNMPIVYEELVEGSELKVTVMPKGAGSENVSQLKMLLPKDAECLTKHIVEVVKNAGGKPCPPVIVGVGIGSTFDGAARLAKKALLRDVRVMNKMEKEILNAINSLGIGPMGLGGKTTALAVLVEIGHCHTASLPLAVNIQCWANRRATAILG